MDGVIRVKATLKDKSVVVEASDSVKVEELLESIATTGYQGEILE